MRTYVDLFPSRLKSLRTAAGLTQQQAATMLKMPAAMWQKYESGERACRRSVRQFCWQISLPFHSTTSPDDLKISQCTVLTAPIICDAIFLAQTICFCPLSRNGRGTFISIDRPAPIAKTVNRHSAYTRPAPTQLIGRSLCPRGG